MKKWRSVWMRLCWLLQDIHPPTCVWFTRSCIDMHIKPQSRISGRNLLALLPYPASLIPFFDAFSKGTQEGIEQRYTTKLSSLMGSFSTSVGLGIICQLVMWRGSYRQLGSLCLAICLAVQSIHSFVIQTDSSDHIFSSKWVNNFESSQHKTLSWPDIIGLRLCDDLADEATYYVSTTLSLTLWLVIRQCIGCALLCMVRGVTIFLLYWGSTRITGLIVSISFVALINPEVPIKSTSLSRQSLIYYIFALFSLLCLFVYRTIIHSPTSFSIFGIQWFQFYS